MFLITFLLNPTSGPLAGSMVPCFVLFCFLSVYGSCVLAFIACIAISLFKAGYFRQYIVAAFVTGSPSLPVWVLAVLIVCLLSEWLGYLSEALPSHSVQTLPLLLGVGGSLGAHCQPGMTEVW